MRILGPDEREAVYRNDILPVFMPPGAYPSAMPRATIVLAQPGVDTTDVIQRKHNDEPSTVVITPERLREFHPADALLQRTNPLEASYLMMDDIEAWTRNLVRDATIQRFNIVMRSTGIDPDGLRAIAIKLQDRGYDVSVHAVAVHPSHSMLSLHQSYEGAMTFAPSAARWTSRFEHDAAAAQLPRTLEDLETSGALTKLHISDRAGECIYANRVLNGYWQQHPSAVSALHAEWYRGPEPYELARHAESWDWVVQQMKERGAPKIEIESAERTAAYGKGTFDMLRQMDLEPVNPYPAHNMVP